jgi:hypothetical protein
MKLWGGGIYFIIELLVIVGYKKIQLAIYNFIKIPDFIKIPVFPTFALSKK